MSWWQRAHERFPLFLLRFPHLFRRPATSTGRTELAMWRARRERQGVAGRQATQAARRLRVVGMTTPRLAERNRMRADARGATNNEERERTVSSPTTPSKLDPHFPYVYWPTPGGDSALSVDRTIPMLLVVTDGQSRAQIYFGTQFRAPRAAQAS